MVFLIAVLPALAVFLIGLITKSKSVTTIAAIIAGLIGLAGGAAYTLIDLAFVAIAYAVVLNSIKGEQTARIANSPVISPPGPVYQKGDKIDGNAPVASPRPASQRSSTETLIEIEEPWEVQRIKKDVADFYLKSRVVTAQWNAQFKNHQEFLHSSPSNEAAEKSTASFHESKKTMQEQGLRFEQDIPDLNARVFKAVSEGKMSQKHADAALNTIAAAKSKFRSL